MDITSKSLLENIDFLLDMKCYRSVELIIHLSVAFIDQNKHLKNKYHNDLKAQLYKVLGDIYYTHSENNQSKGYYQQSMIWMSSCDPSSVITSMSKSNLAHQFTNNTQSISVSNSLSSKPSSFNQNSNTASNSNTSIQNSINSVTLYEMKYNIALTHIGNKEYSIALKELETIPSIHRTIKIQMELSRVYLKLNMKKQAILVLKHVLLSSSIVVEAIEQLADLGIDCEEILTFSQVRIIPTTTASAINTATAATTTSAATKSLYPEKENKSGTKTKKTINQNEHLIQQPPSQSVSRQHPPPQQQQLQQIQPGHSLFSVEFYTTYVSFICNTRQGNYALTLRDFQTLKSKFTAITTSATAVASATSGDALSAGIDIDNTTTAATGNINNNNENVEPVPCSNATACKSNSNNINNNSSNTNNNNNNINTSNSRSQSTQHTASVPASVTASSPLNCVVLMSAMAQASLESGHTLDAYLLLQAVRKLQPLYIHNLDVYAELLYFHSKDGGCDLVNSSNNSNSNNECINTSRSINNACYKELYTLANDILSISVRSSVDWLIMAMASEACNEHEKTTLFLEKALRIDPCYAHSYIIKGRILQQRGLIEQALSSFLEANNLQSSIWSYKGILECYQLLGNVKHACKLSIECLKLYPTSHTILTTVSRLYASHPSTDSKYHNDAVSLSAKALKLNPSSLVALHVYVESLIVVGSFQDGINILKHSIRFQQTSYKSYLLLGRCLMACHMYGEASEALQISISLASKQMTVDIQPIAAELDKVDVLMKENPQLVTASVTASAGTSSYPGGSSGGRDVSGCDHESHLLKGDSSSSSASVGVDSYLTSHHSPQHTHKQATSSHSSAIHTHSRMTRTGGSVSGGYTMKTTLDSDYGYPSAIAGGGAVTSHTRTPATVMMRNTELFRSGVSETAATQYWSPTRRLSGSPVRMTGRVAPRTPGRHEHSLTEHDPSDAWDVSFEYNPDDYAEGSGSECDSEEQQVEEEDEYMVSHQDDELSHLSSVLTSGTRAVAATTDRHSYSHFTPSPAQSTRPQRR